MAKPKSSNPRGAPPKRPPTTVDVAPNIVAICDISVPRGHIRVVDLASLLRINPQSLKHLIRTYPGRVSQEVALQELKRRERGQQLTGAERILPVDLLSPTLPPDVEKNETID